MNDIEKRFMRRIIDMEDEILFLQYKMKSLEKENQYLKSLLDQAGISYHVPVEAKGVDLFELDQGKRIIPREITDKDANLFFSMFWGRTDVYAKRTVKKSTGEVNYYTQCYNYWKTGCPRMNGSKIKCQDCKRQAYKKLEKQQIMAHLRGASEEATDVIGVYPLLEDDTCRFLVFDFDNHEKNAEKCDFANIDDTWRQEVDALREICVVNGIDPLVERSRSGHGAHLWIFFQKKTEASLARKFGNALLRKGAESVSLKSFRFYDRMLPMQDRLSTGGIGNLIALPLQGQALKEGNSAFVDENWNAYPDQWETLLSKPKLSKEFVEEKIKEWKSFLPNEAIAINEVLEQDGEKPWDKTRDFLKCDVDGEIQITLADGIYVFAENLAPRIQNRIRELVAFRNPAFYKNLAMGLSNFSNSRYIYLGREEGGYIRIPRGLLEDVTARCDKAGIVNHICDERCPGNEIRATFEGQLKEPQLLAAEAILKHETGILHDATASDTFVEVLQEVRAKYVYGVTATPLRSDGLEKINYMLLGPVRYQYTAKDRARDQGIAHLVYPRFTRAVAPRFRQDNMHPNEAYTILRENEDRDNLIITDVKKCIEEGRTPVVLSRYVDHSRKLYDRLRNCADEVFLLSGENSKKQYSTVLQKMKQVATDKSMILVATGKLIGEGFDFPRLDTLIMAMPVSWKSVVEQYAGRLNRDYEGKKSVIIYDYVDSHISMFEKMYHKRLKAYKQIGYDICTGNTVEIQNAGAIFDIDTYTEVYRKDLLEANEEIIIASPIISGPKIEELIQLLKPQQEKGVRIRIVTWKADSYGFGDSAYWMELQERMRSNGFEMNLVEDYCQHYCIVDREVVWYGSMNFLGKEDSDDNLMRVCSKEIAAELLEITFGKREVWD